MSIVHKLPQIAREEELLVQEKALSKKACSNESFMFEIYRCHHKKRIFSQKTSCSYKNRRCLICQACENCESNRCSSLLEANDSALVANDALVAYGEKAFPISFDGNQRCLLSRMIVIVMVVY